MPLTKLAPMPTNEPYEVRMVKPEGYSAVGYVTMNHDAVVISWNLPEGGDRHQIEFSIEEWNKLLDLIGVA